MQVEVTFKTGDLWNLQSLYICEMTHYFASDEAYYIVPCKDIEISRVTVDEFAKIQREAKFGPEIGESDIGKVLVKPKMVWREIKSD